MNALDIETAKKISDLILDGKTLDELRKSLDFHGGTINAWITESLLSDDIDSALSTLRAAIIARVLKDTAILGLLKAASTPGEYKSYKTTILSELSKQDKALLEQLGYQDFAKQVEDRDIIILKVEETINGIAPDPSLFKEILKSLNSGEIEATSKLMPFNPTHADCPPV